MICFECLSNNIKIDGEIIECLNCGIYLDIHKKDCDCFDCDLMKIELKGNEQE